MESRIFAAFATVNIFIALIQVAVALEGENSNGVLRDKKNEAEATNGGKKNAPPKVNANPKVGLQKMVKNVKEADKQFASKSLPYRMFVRPILHVVRGIGLIAARLLGTTVVSAGETLQVLGNAAHEGVVAKNGGKPTDPLTEAAFDDIHNAGETVKGWGQKVNRKSEKALDKMKGNAKKHSDNADTSKAQQSVAHNISRPESPSVHSIHH